MAESVSAGNFDREPGYTYPATSGPYAPKPFKPQQYMVCRTVDTITVDGKMNETSWKNAEWTNLFGHIYKKGYKKPFLATRAKMLWDDTNFYAAVELEEPNLMGHVIDNDAEIYDDNDIEMFIDFDSDSQNYIELEFNCLGTVWDMLLPKEYNRGGIPFSHPKIPQSRPWDLEGMRVAVKVDGSLNYPHDTDSSWTIEISMPWESLQKTSRTEQKLNRNGSYFRVNFSRVQHPWPKDVWPVEDWKNRGGPCWDWTWSPNLVYNMHSCESWGRVILLDHTVLESPYSNKETAFSFVDPPPPPKKPRLGSMVKIKGGTYLIGPDYSDPDASPQGEVTVDDYYIDRYEVTIGGYVNFLNAVRDDKYYEEDMADPDMCGIVKDNDGKYSAVSGKELYPIVFVSIEGALAYAQWAGKRLPTEYEWEIAAGGNNGHRYPWGNESPDPGRVNYNYYTGHTTPVGSFEKGKTPEGIYDMAGNVWELIDGKWSGYPWNEQAQKSLANAQLMRGGSWVTSGENLDTTYRDAVKGQWSAMVGFRCAKDAD